MVLKQPAPGQGSALSNLATDRAVAAGEHFQRYRASRRESIEAYIAAGAALDAGLAEVPYRSRSAFYQRTGIPRDTAERMLVLARAGLTVNDVLRHGGIRAAVDVYRTKRGSNDPHRAVLSAPDSTAPEAHSGAAEGRGGPEAGVGQGRPAYGPPAPSGAPERVDDGRCRCGRERAPGRRQCPACLARDRTRTRGRLAGGKMAVALARRIREAAARGAGLRLSPDDVAGLVASEGKAYRERLAKVGRR